MIDLSKPHAVVGSFNGILKCSVCLLTICNIINDLSEEAKIVFSMYRWMWSSYTGDLHSRSWRRELILRLKLFLLSTLISVISNKPWQSWEHCLCHSHKLCLFCSRVMSWIAGTTCASAHFDRSWVELFTVSFLLSLEYTCATKDPTAVYRFRSINLVGHLLWLKLRTYFGSNDSGLQDSKLELCIFCSCTKGLGQSNKRRKKWLLTSGQAIPLVYLPSADRLSSINLSHIL